MERAENSRAGWLCALALVTVSFAAPLLDAEESTAGKPPNVIVCMVDDMGFSDLGCYGSEIPTPHLDALAKDGIRFANFHNTSRCCPSRASVLTGLYPHHTGQGHFFKPGKGPGYQGGMYRPHVTLGHVGQAVGYDTMASGKWHVLPTITSKPKGGEAGRGFMNFAYSRFDGSQNYFPARDRETGKLVDENGDFGYVTHWYAKGVCEQAEASHAAGRPFLVYWSPNAPHYPLHALSEDLEVVDGMYDGEPLDLAKARMRRLTELGFVKPEWPFTMPRALTEPDKSWQQDVRSEKDAYPPPADYKWAANGNRKLQSARRAKDYGEIMEFYAAQIVALDKSVGTVVAKLKELGEYDNTLILFCSDNGCSAEGRSTGKTWAALSDLPYQRYKMSAYGGGVRSPLIMSWPARIDASQKGSINQTYGHLIDVMPTVLEAIGGSYPAKDFIGRPLPALPGRSLLPALQGETVSLAQPIFISHAGNIAVITEQWKVLSDAGEPWRLHAMDTDPLEHDDVAKDHPAIVFKMAAQWQTWATRVGARPGGMSSKGPDGIRTDTMDPWDKVK